MIAFNEIQAALPFRACVSGNVPIPWRASPLAANGERKRRRAEEIFIAREAEDTLRAKKLRPERALDASANPEPALRIRNQWGM